MGGCIFSAKQKNFKYYTQKIKINESQFFSQQIITNFAGSNYVSGNTDNWRASEASETLSGVYKFELMRYVYKYIYIYVWRYVRVP